MAKFKVEIRREYFAHIDIEAESFDEAYNKAENKEYSDDDETILSKTNNVEVICLYASKN